MIINLLLLHITKMHQNTQDKDNKHQTEHTIVTFQVQVCHH